MNIRLFGVIHSAISKATNITIERLAQWNNIYNIDLVYAGNKLVFDGNVVSLKDAEGNTISQAVIQDTDKIDPTKPIGEEAIQILETVIMDQMSLQNRHLQQQITDQETDQQNQRRLQQIMDQERTHKPNTTSNG